MQHRTTSAREPLDSDMHHHFPMIEAGEVDIYNPDRNNRVEVKGRLAHCGEQLTSFLLTRSPLQVPTINPNSSPPLSRCSHATLLALS